MISAFLSVIITIAMCIWVFVSVVSYMSGSIYPSKKSWYDFILHLPARMFSAIFSVLGMIFNKKRER